ncbi:MAG TPA: hypothetical protein VH562_05380 [Nitrosopumilaceae archaeon]|jgi:hypothetical protein
MGHKSRVMYIMIVVLALGVITSVTMAFADEVESNSSNPLGMLYGFFQEFKYGFISDIFNELTPNQMNSAAVIVQLKDEVEDLKTRINSLENPEKIFHTELYPVTDIDCSERNMVEAFLSGWCPHQTRNIYFIEDSRVQEDSVIAISIEQKIDREASKKPLCGVINQDVFNFSFQDEKTGKSKLLQDLHGFIMKCDHSPVDSNSILKYTIINA